jgi:hypothetical protein
MQSYKKVKLMLMADTLTTTMPDMTSKWQQKSYKEKEKVHDGAKEVHRKQASASKKMKRDSNKFKGWSDEAKAFIIKMMKAIKVDVELGAHGKWEKLYKKICEAMNKSDQIDQGSSSSDDKMDYSILYAKVQSKYKI